MLRTAVIGTAVALAAVAFGLAGLEKGDNELPLLSSAEVAREANAICERFELETRDVVDPGPAGLPATAAYLDKIIPSMAATLDEFHDLRPRPSVQRDVKSLVMRYEALLRVTLRMRDAARASDFGEFTEPYRRAITLSYETSSQASRLGWTSCA